MIKTILKHYIFDRLLNSLFDNVITVFTPFNPVFNVGDTFSHIQLSNHYNNYKAIECTTSLMNCKVGRITTNMIMVHYLSGYETYIYESNAIANKMYFNYNILNSILDDNKIIIGMEYNSFCGFSANRIIQLG